MRTLLLMLLLIPITLQAGILDDSVYTVSNYLKQETLIPMRDGVRLFTSIYLPKNASGKSPILITRTPYSVAPYGTSFRPFWRNHWMHYVKSGYILVFQDVRGRYMSEGTFEDVRPKLVKPKAKEIDESTDSHDTFNWLLKNIQGHNGKIGITGSSYPGFYAAMGAMSGHPALKAAIPQAPVTDWFMGDDFHHNGAFFLLDAFQFYSSFGKPRPNPTTENAKGYSFPNQDNYAFFLRAGSLSNILPLLGDANQFWKSVFEHPNYDEFWKARNSRNHVNSIKNHTATLVVGGLFDAEDVFGAFRLSEAISNTGKVNHYLAMGPWYHGQWYRDPVGNRLGNAWFQQSTTRFYQDSIEIPFLEYHLRGVGKIEALSKRNVFFSGINQWFFGNHWPPQEAKDQVLYLQSAGKIAISPDHQLGSSTSYWSDPSKPVPYTEDVHLSRTREYMTDDQRFAARRPDVLVFQSPPLDTMLCVGGPVQADFHLAITTTDLDVVVKIIDEFPDDYKTPVEAVKAGIQYPMSGYQMLVRGEVMRGRFRNNFAQPEAFKPNTIEHLTFQLPDIAHCWLPGHRLMVQVQSSWFPLVDRNPQQMVNIYQCKDVDFIPTKVTIMHDRLNPSTIKLFLIKFP